jgi:ABC-2 type transport system ATP-binding protein
MAYTLDVRGLRKSYGDKVVLAGLDLQVRPGEIVALLGPNGTGKTTTVRILSTLIRADGGTALVAGHDVGADRAAVRGAISLTGQYAAVDEVLTGRENLVTIGRLRRLGRTGARSRAAELLDQFDLVDAADRRVSTYSGGMRRRLDLAMSLVVRPTVLFLDEPTAGLDPRSRRDMWAAVGTLASSGVTVLLTTQYLEEADVLADRVAVLDRGRKVAEGTPAELKAQVGSDTVELAFADGRVAAAARGVLEAVGRTVIAGEPGRRAGAEPDVAEPDRSDGLDGGSTRFVGSDGVGGGSTGSDGHGRSDGHVGSDGHDAGSTGAPTGHATGTTVRVAGAGTAEDVRGLLDLLAEHGVPAARLSLHRPSLDEVFLTLTDHRTDQGAEAEARTAAAARPEPPTRPLETIR